MALFQWLPHSRALGQCDNITITFYIQTPPRPNVEAVLLRTVTMQI